jgi:flagellar basal-body rod protein FlgB
MQSVLDQYLGIHTPALTLEAQRMQVLASNLANVDTPNYKAQDVDFKAALAAADNSSAGSAPTQLPLATTHANDLTAAGSVAGTAAGENAGSLSTSALPSAESALKYRVPLAPALDGNTVDEQLEQSAFAENSVRYQATLTFLNTKLRLLMNALSSS